MGRCTIRSAKTGDVWTGSGEEGSCPGLKTIGDCRDPYIAV